MEERRKLKASTNTYELQLIDHDYICHKTFGITSSFSLSPLAHYPSLLLLLITIRLSYLVSSSFSFTSFSSSSSSKSHTLVPVHNNVMGENSNTVAFFRHCIHIAKMETNWLTSRSHRQLAIFPQFSLTPHQCLLQHHTSKYIHKLIN